jgi:hypothetical protein
LQRERVNEPVAKKLPLFTESPLSNGSIRHNIKLDLNEIISEDVDRIQLAQDRKRNMPSGNGISGSIQFWEFLEYLSNYWLLKKDSSLWR